MERNRKRKDEDEEEVKIGGLTLPGATRGGGGDIRRTSFSVWLLPMLFCLAGWGGKKN